MTDQQFARLTLAHQICRGVLDEFEADPGTPKHKIFVLGAAAGSLGSLINEEPSRERFEPRREVA